MPSMRARAVHDAAGQEQNAYRQLRELHRQPAAVCVQKFQVCQADLRHNISVSQDHSAVLHVQSLAGHECTGVCSISALALAQYLLLYCYAAAGQIWHTWPPCRLGCAF